MLCTQEAPELRAAPAGSPTLCRRRALSWRCVSSWLSSSERKTLLHRLKIFEGIHERDSSVFRVGDYRVAKPIGSGCTGDVFMAVHSKTGERVAIKTQLKNRGPHKERRTRKEYSVMSKLTGHPNVCHLRGVVENEKRICVIMQYAEGGDLFDYVRNRGCLSEAEAWRLFRQIVSALIFIHGRGFIHRDLKLENIFLDKDNNVLLGDFGFATSWSPVKAKKKFYGTLEYASPEIVGHDAYTGPEVDLWSLGVVLYTMLTGAFPFGAKDTVGVYRKIKAGTFQANASLSPAVTSLLDRLLNPHPLKRATMLDVLNHPWYQNAPVAPCLGRSLRAEKRRRSMPDKTRARTARFSAANSMAVVEE